MTDSNRLELLRVRETTLGTTPSSPDMTKIRVTSESFKYAKDFIESQEIRDDRMTQSTIETGGRVNGGFSGEFSFGTYDPECESALSNTLTKTVEIENSAADTEITEVTNSSDTYTVASGGDDFVLGHLVRASGFGETNNNRQFKVSSSTATTVVADGTPTLTDEAAPPAGAKLKVIGFQATGGDLSTVSDGITSSTLDFTTLGITAGQWLKIDSTTLINGFPTSANNDWLRCTAVAANKLTCDHLPSGWTTESSVSRPVKVYFGDILRNGTTTIGHTYQKALLGQSTPQYMPFRGNVVDTMALNFPANGVMSVDFGMLGFAGDDPSSTSLDSTPTDATSTEIMNTVTNLGSVYEGGSAVGTPNFIQSANINTTNDLREQTGIFEGSELVGVGKGKFGVGFSITTYFGDASFYNKYLNKTSTSFSVRNVKDSQAVITTIPKAEFNDAEVLVGGGNQDVVVNMTGIGLASDNTSSAYNIQMDFLSEYE